MSYLDFYDLEKEPFHVTPDPEFLFLSPSHKEALGVLLYGISKRKGIIALTGEVGVGKTTVLRSYLQRIDPEELKVIYLFNASIPFYGLIRLLLKELSEEPQDAPLHEWVDSLHQVLIEEYKKGRNVALIVDEAQNMPVDTLENLRMLSNLETGKEKLLQIVLIGQPELEEKLNEYRLRQLRQRIAVRSTIRPLTHKESKQYIECRLLKCKTNNLPIFSSGAIRRIIHETEGIPRLMNILCDNALITGYGYQRKKIGRRIANEVIADFNGQKGSSALRWFAGTLVLLILVAALVLILNNPSRRLFAGSIDPPEQPIPVRTESPSTAAEKTNTVPSFVPPLVADKEKGLQPIQMKERAARIQEKSQSARGGHKIQMKTQPKTGAVDRHSAISREFIDARLTNSIDRHEKRKKQAHRELDVTNRARATTSERSKEVEIKTETPASETITLPKVTHTVKAIYPGRARAQSPEGSVVLNVLVSESGTAEDVQILRGVKGNETFGDAAIAAIQKWKFRPGMKNGRPDKMWVAYSIAFRQN